MIRCLAVATLFILLAACGEPAPTRWPTTTPVPTAVSEAESAECPDASSGDESQAEVVITESGLQIRDLVVGVGPGRRHCRGSLHRLSGGWHQIRQFG